MGELRFEPSGLLRGALSGLDDDSLLDGLNFQISRAGGVHGTVHREGRSFHTSPLSSGEYRLAVLGDFVEPIYRTISIGAGEEREVQLELERAGLRIVRIDTAELQAARWFLRAEIIKSLDEPGAGGLTVPGSMAIAHHLIRAWSEGRDA